MTLRPLARLALAAGLALPLALAAAPRAARAADEPLIVIGSPSFRPLPIAVVDFGDDGSARPAATDATKVVRSDLALSGLFDVLDPKGFLADPAEGYAAPSIRFARWVDVGADGLVKARVRAVEGGALEGELHLYEVRAGREALSTVLRVAAAEPRRLAHKMADAVVRYYTHEPGPFASRIAAIRKRPGQYQLVMMDVDGGSPRVLLTEARTLLAPAWSPDGKAILVTSYRTGYPALWLYRLDGGSFRPLGGVPNAMGGAYSPDGSKIAFSVIRGGYAEIWVMNADGSGARALTRSGSIDVTPAWSPDGRRIAFSSDRAGTPQLYVMSADGSDPRRITFQGNYNQTPQWSPRGDQIAFTARDERLVFDLFAISPQTGVITRITQDQGRTNQEPSWAPNGRLMVFRTDRAGPWQLVISDARGDKQTVIAGDAGAELAGPAWGPAEK